MSTRAVPAAPIGRPTTGRLAVAPGASDRGGSGLSVVLPARSARSVGTMVAVSDAVVALVALVLVVTWSPWRSAAAGGVTGGLATVGLSWASFLLAYELLKVPAAVRRQVVPSVSDGLGRAVAAVAVSSFLLLDLGVLAGPSVSRLLGPAEVLAGVLCMLVLLPLGRAVGLAWCDRLGLCRSRVVVLGTGTIALDVARRIDRAPLVDFMGFVDDDPSSGTGVLGPVDALATLCARDGIDRVVVAFSRAHPAAVAQTLRQLGEQVSISVVPRYFDLTGWEARMGDLDGLPTVSLGTTPSGTARTTKRALDLAGALVGLVVLLPLLLAAAAAVRLTSPGPALFRQLRLGWRRAPFEIIKFRTMRQPAPEAASPTDGGEAATADLELDQARVTPVGRLLRRSGIDELPQLVNVLLGQMSLVGPRPFVPEECDRLPAWAEQRFDLRPGMTGLWQVCGQHSLRVEELHRLDTHYVRSWSLGCDLRILAKTPERLLRGGGDRVRFRGLESTLRADRRTAGQDRRVAVPERRVAGQERRVVPERSRG